MLSVGAQHHAHDQAVADLKQLAVSELSALRGGPDLLRTVEDDPEAVRRVALHGDVVVGYSRLSLSEQRATLTVLYVHPEMRGVGAGHALLGQARVDAQQHGVEHLDSYALPGDRNTKNFFESHAMKSRLLVVHQELTP